MKRMMQLVMAACVLAAASGSAVYGQATKTPGLPQGEEALPKSFKFSFGTSAPQGFTKVDAAARYSDKQGYGFENIGGGFPEVPPDSVKDTGYITAKSPVFFSVKLPEGNYRVTVHLGGTVEGTTTVKAELRRLMLEQIHTAAGQHVSKTFAVNVHKPAIRDENGKQVSTTRISGREVGGRGGSGEGLGGVANLNRTQGGEGWSWDDTLTLEFSGKPVVRAVEITRDDSIHNIFIAGDSTVCDQPAAPFTSWGQVITRWIKPDYSVSNYAISGNSAPAFYSAQRMAKITSQLRPGDFVIVQYGHNDMKNTAANALQIYKDHYTRFIDDTRAKGATPIMLTPVSRKSFGEGDKITNSFLVRGTDDYIAAVREVVKAKECLFFDLNAKSAIFYETIGKANIQPAFANASEGTHHSDWGAYEIARCVMQGLIDLKVPIAQSVTDDWKPYDPAKPGLFADYKVPPDPMPGGRGGATPAGN
jgi:lysophospholipase L1-like esterase